MAIEFHLGCLPNRPVEACLRLGRRAEELGYAGIWMADSHTVMRDAYGLLAVLATQTRTLKLASGITPTVTRHPAVLANSWATLQELSRGRALCGLGVGESAVRNLGLRPERLAAFEKKLQCIGALLRGEAVVYNGHELCIAWPTRPVPLIVAASGPKSLQLAGRLADGVLFQVGADPGLVNYALDNIRRGCDTVGRNFNDIQLYMRIGVAVADDPAQARHAMRGYAAVAANTIARTVPPEYLDQELRLNLARLKAHYRYRDHGRNDALHSDLLTERIIAAVAVATTPNEAAARFQALTALGVHRFVWPAGMADPEPFLQTFAEHVMPLVKVTAQDPG